MTQENLLKHLLAIYDHDDKEDISAYSVERIDACDEATLYAVKFERQKFAVVVLNETDNTYRLPLMFANKDRTLPCPASGKEIKDYEWICIQNRKDAVVINDLPQLSPWDK